MTCFLSHGAQTCHVCPILDLKCIDHTNYGILELLLWKLKMAVNLPPLTAPKAIADRMIRVGYEKECCQVYSNVRRDVLDECLAILGVEKLSIKEVQRIEWKVLDEKMKKWIQAVKVVKLWHLRVTIMEAQDLQIAVNLSPLTAPEVRVKAQLGFQSVRTRRDRTRDDPVLLGHVLIPVAAIEQRSYIQ
nr:exocyst complex component EXO70B1 [Tanacetum cinerariifolium]